MKNAVLLLAGAVVAGIVFTLAPLKAQPAAENEKPAAPKWEYLSEGEDRLEERGDQGWELVAVTRSDFGGRCYFKRPKE